MRSKQIPKQWKPIPGAVGGIAGGPLPRSKQIPKQWKPIPGAAGGITRGPLPCLDQSKFPRRHRHIQEVPSLPAWNDSLMRD